MFLVGSLSAAGRRTVFTFSLAALLMAPSGAAAQAAAAPAAQQDAFNFASSDAGLIVWTVPEAQMADFESVWGTILGKLNASAKPELKELGSTLLILRPQTPAPGQPVQYFIVSHPASKTTTNPTFLLYSAELFTREEAEALFKKLPTSGNPSPIAALPMKKVQASAVSATPAPTPGAPAPGAPAPGAPAPGAPATPPVK